MSLDITFTKLPTQHLQPLCQPKGNAEHCGLHASTKRQRIFRFFVETSSANLYMFECYLTVNKYGCRRNLSEWSKIRTMKRDSNPIKVLWILMNENVPTAWDFRVANRKKSSKTVNQYLETKITLQKMQSYNRQKVWRSSYGTRTVHLMTWSTQNERKNQTTKLSKYNNNITNTMFCLFLK